MSALKCYSCPHVEHYYRGKNRKPNCLKVARCEAPGIEKDPQAFNGGGSRPWGRRIALWRLAFWSKVKTSPRWCPLKPKKEAKP